MNYIKLLARIKDDAFFKKALIDATVEHDDDCSFCNRGEINPEKECDCHPRVVATNMDNGKEKIFRWDDFNWGEWN